MGVVGREIAWAVRRLARRPLWAVVAVAAVAVGVAPSLMFQLVSRAVLRPLPFDRPSDLVALWQHVPLRLATSYPKLHYLAEHSHTIDLAAETGVSLVLERRGTSRQFSGTAVDPEIFRILGTRPLLGRVFRDDENSAALNEPAVILSERVWREEFAGSPDVLGQRMALNGVFFRVVGVMPRGFSTGWFQGLALPGDLWIPAMAAPVGMRAPQWRDSLRIVESVDAAVWVGVGRIRDGYSLTEARTEADLLGGQVSRMWPGSEAQVGVASRPYVLTRLSEDAVDPKVLDAVSLLRVAGGLVLLLGGLNLASLFVARGVERSRAMGLRAALGAPRHALVAGFLAEATIVSVFGGLGAIALTRMALAGLGSVEPSLLTAPFGANVDPSGWRFDIRLLAGAVVVSTLAGLGFSLWPALRFIRRATAEALRSGPGITAGGLRSIGLTRPAGLLVSVEIAVALAVVAPALLLARSLEGLLTADLGFQADHVLTAPLSLPASRYSEDALAPFVDRALREISAIPGVEAASWMSCLPVECGYFTSALRVSGAPERGVVASVHTVTPGAFDVLGIPIRQGRDFASTDGKDAPPVVILSEQGARELGVTELGARLAVGETRDVDVVGIVGDVPYGELTREALPAVYFTLAQRPGAKGFLLVRSSLLGPQAIAGPVGRAVSSLDPLLGPTEISTLEGRVGRSIARFRGAAWLLAVAALLALLLCGVGVYGVLSSLVARSVPEIGIRMALGASPSAIRWSLTGAALALATVGASIGSSLGTWAAHYLRGYLYGVRPGDPAALLAGLGGAAALAVAAAFVPATRASQVDPIGILRRE